MNVGRDLFRGRLGGFLPQSGLELERDRIATWDSLFHLPQVSQTDTAMAVGAQFLRLAVVCLAVGTQAYRTG